MSNPQAKWDIDLASPYAHMPDFAHLRPEAQDAMRETIRKKIIDQIYADRDRTLEDAITKALALKCGLAFKSELVIDSPHPLMEAQSNVVTHRIRLFLTDTSPWRGDWKFLPYETIKELWDRRSVEDVPKVG